MAKTIHNASDKADFGQYKGLTFIEIFKYTKNYIEWLITDTEHCFYNLDDFFANGLPYDFAIKKLTIKQQQATMSYLKANTPPSSAGSYRVDKNTASKLIQQGTLSADYFVETPYSFSESMFQFNLTKRDKILGIQ